MSPPIKTGFLRPAHAHVELPGSLCLTRLCLVGPRASLPVFSGAGIKDCQCKMIAMQRFTRRAFLAGVPLAAVSPKPVAARPRPAGQLKITEFVFHKASRRWRDLLFVEIHTDAGITGLGEGTCHGRVDIVEEALRWLERRMKGHDPAGPEYHWRRNYWDLTRWRRGPMLMTALSAVDIALWDIEGKRLGVPVHRLLGGPLHRKLRVYYSHWNSEMGERTPANFARYTAKTKANGWTAVKWGVPGGATETEQIRNTVAEVEAVREAGGPDFDIGLELAERFSLRSAIRLAKAIEPYDVLFIEEPLKREAPWAFGELAEKSPVPIATGEGLLSRYQFKQLLDVRGAQIIQPDVVKVGGITEIRKIADLAETYNIEVAPHQPYGPIAHVASIHAMSTIRNFLIHEWEADDEALFADVSRGTFPVQKGGVVELPETPGLGITVDFAELVKRQPYKG